LYSKSQATIYWTSLRLRAKNITTDHSQQSIFKAINQLQPDKPIKGLSLHRNKIKGPLAIPNFSISLPQSTTNTIAPKILNAQSTLIAMDNINKNSKDINQKIQQRKAETARRQEQPLKPNLQVNFTHELKLIVANATLI